MRIDIKDFFDSISEDVLISCLKDYIKDDEAISVLIDICTLNSKLPQGAVTSPLLSNLVLKK